MLKPLPDKTCQVFVHNSSSLHHLLIEVRRKRSNKPDVIMARIPGPLASIDGPPHRSHGLTIRKVAEEEESLQKGVKAYTGVERPEGRRLSDSFTLSDIVDVPLGDVDPVRGRPSILIDDGIFYTAEVVNIRAKLVKKTGEETELTQVPTIIGANIYIDDPQRQAVNLRWRQQGVLVGLALRSSPGVTYEIYIMNDPLYEEDSPTTPDHDEFGEYFNLLPAVPENSRFSLQFPPQPIPDRGSSRSPCMSVVIDDGGE